jgi:pimeloyl-ACP methyl ester carboxylesterase/tetratricopeptide (TPR) repeat protein
MSKKIRLRGIEVDNSEVSSFKIDLEKGKSETIVPISKGRVRLGVSRDIGGLVELPDMQADDIACVEYANGFKLWTRVDDLYRENAVHSTRGVADEEVDVWEIDPQPRVVGAERGAVSLAIEALEFFGVDLKGVAATELCKWFEARQLQKEGPGLYQCRSLASDLQLDKVPGDSIDATGKPILLFIHGTGSSSAGGFGKLWTNAKEAGVEARKALQEKYGEACYAFDHRSLTVSPIDNALDIAKTLPEHAEVHLVTHSRGGLVGELLCLGQRDKTSDPLQDDLLDTIFDAEKDRTQGELFGLGLKEPKAYKPGHYKEQKKQLLKLREVLDEKQIKVTRFVRVACPALGTTLASGRLDRWLSIIQHLTGGNDFIQFLLGVLKERTDPRTLPGLEAMMPGSGLVRLLNYPDLKVSADLTVIAGDIEANSVWSKLKLQLVDWFYDSEHDLVVNTGSMYGGLARKEGSARFFFDQGNDVSHFNYFKNEESVQKLAAGLLRADSDPAGYQAISLAKPKAPARGVRRAALSSGPLAIVLHGTMGSHLAQDNDKIWLDYRALCKGRLAELGITMPRVVSLGLLDDFYGDFVDYLGASHRVEPFHYDWRLSIIDSAHALSRLVSSRLADCEAKRQPIRFVAHSMGGLVVRAMFTLYPDLWRRFQALQGSRFMMLGTPNAGSYEAVRWLTGWNPTLGKLSWLDIAHDTAGLVNIVNRYPGLLELLPSNDDKNYSDPALWEQICAGGDKNWPLPQADSLKNLGKAWQLVRDSPIDSERMIYVAGWAPETVCAFANMSGRGIFSKERPPVRFYPTKKGDGTVPWALGLLPGVKTWYVPEAAHDQLLAYSPAFPAYIDLLQSGATSRLSQEEPGASRDAGISTALSVMSDGMPDSMPSEADLSSFVFGAGYPVKRAKQRRLPKVNVSICHGNLAYACYPVCVGHYYGDTIVSAEAYLDRRMDGALSKRVSLGLYPGELNSHAIFLHQDKNAKPNGAIVIGLGRVGQLSPGMLASGISQALLDYALKVNEWPDDRFGAAGTVRSAKVSFLLIGTGFGGMSIRDSIERILIGVKSANERLAETCFDDKVLFDNIEFLEIYQDVVIKAARELGTILRDVSLQEHFTWQDQTIKVGPGALQRVLFEEDPNWWHRLEIVYDKKYQILRFIALTERARAEVTLVSGQMRLADEFINDMIGETGNSRLTSQTLFEMLIPNRLKESAPDHYDLVLILDEESARYPWELLEDRWGPAHKPAAVAAGMLRQLKTQQFRARPLQTSQKNAFVVGNPVIPVGSDGVIFPDLPGAAQEAEAVAGLLTANGYDVNKALDRRFTNLDAKAILNGLHGGAYRILHLAGHGVHEFEIEKYFPVKETCQACGQDKPTDEKRVSGMVIGDNIFLTPGDVEQMRWVPELVFINCCHLGSTDVRYPEARRYNELAANLGTQFINMGVKAVVAAGWAVDDGAAKAFAEAFYQSMLSGGSFGIAVLAARKQIYEQFPDVNTWGAYQCYGDPDFRLFDDGQNDKKQLPHYYVRAEWVSDLENIVSTMRSNNSGEGNEEWRQWLESCFKRVPDDKLEDWQKQADVAAALGTVYGELGDYERAIDHLDKAMAANKAEFPVKALEQRANYRVKHALQFRQTADKTEKDITLDEIERAIDELNFLISLTPTKGQLSTKERLSLLGSAYKRQAWLQSTKAKRKTALEEMRNNYQLAFNKGLESKNIDAYPLTNWITAEVILSWFDKHHDQSWKQDLPGWVTQAIADAKQKMSVNPEYWDSVVEPDCLLMMGLINGEFKAEDIKRIVEGYRLATERGASEKDKAALREHIEFLIYMAEQVKPKQNELWKSLQVIFRQLA